MKKIHILLTLSSLNVLLVTVERFSFTTKIILQPYSFLRLHELIQMMTVILFTVLIPFFILQTVTDNFKALRTRQGLLLGAIFITGIYFYATGNGVHELGSFLFNHYCDTTRVSGDQCGTLFFNDYYTGNIMYFFGAFLMNIPILLFERDNPQKMSRRDKGYITANALFYALAIFAYSGFDRVLVGLVYTVMMLVSIVYLIASSKEKISMLPYTLYSLIAYTVGGVASVFVRLM